MSSGSLEQAHNRLRTGFERLSSARQINRAADNSAGLSISERLKALEATANQAVRNLNDGVSVTRVAESGLSEVSSNLGRMRELSIQARNGTLGDSERAVLQQEYDALAAEVTRATESSEFNGQKLLNGETSGADAMQFEDGSAGEGLELSVSSHSAGSLGLEGLDLTSSEALAKIDTAQQQVSSTRASLGSLENRLGSQVRSLQVQSESLAEAESRIRDTDFARTIADVTRDRILEQMGVAVRGQANASASVALQLL